MRYEPNAANSAPIYLVGAFPPPVQGAAVVNQAMREMLCARGIEPVILNLSPTSLRRSWLSRLSRVRNVIRATFKYFRKKPDVGGDTLYVGLSGSWGQLYEIFFIMVARMRGDAIFLHHHSFAYLDKKSLLTNALVRLAGQSATHIVLCGGQARKLKLRYGEQASTTVLSNAVLVSTGSTSQSRIRTQLRTVGFLGNISFEKGIAEVIAIAKELESKHSDLKVEVAGPFADGAAETVLREAVARSRILRYVGPRYGSEKEDFWESIDVLLFPSRYSHECAPLVVYEAMARGIPAIAWDRGCLSDMLAATPGLLVSQDQDFVSHAVQRLQQWQDNPALLSEASRATLLEFSEQRKYYLCTRDALLAALSKSPALQGTAEAAISR